MHSVHTYQILHFNFFKTELSLQAFVWKWLEYGRCLDLKEAEVWKGPGFRRVGNGSCSGQKKPGS
jgi:hypothetical protein